MTEDKQRMTEVRDDYFADALTNMQPHCDELVGRLADAMRGQAVPRADEAIISSFDGSHSNKQPSSKQPSTEINSSQHQPFQGPLSKYGFTHVTSSPRFPQSNGMAEAGVKIAKMILKKNQDPSLGLLEYRSTPLENGYSPAELLMGRKLRTTLPIAPENLNPKYANLGIVKQKASVPRSYMVDTPVGTIRRNRFHLRKGVAVQYPADPSTPTFSGEDLVENEKTPVVDYPSNDSEDGQIRTRSLWLDNIPNEAIKALPPSYLTALKDIYNRVLKTGQFPTTWCKTIIHPIFKNGDADNPQNYRGISLLSNLAKLFSSILKIWLSNWTENRAIIPENQAGFRKEHSCQDHIFTLVSLIQLTLRRKRRKFYAFFIDLKKAFDTVPQALLWKKLLDIGLNFRFINLIKNYYENMTAALYKEIFKKRNLQLCRELYSSTRKYSRKEIYSSAENTQLYKEIFKKRNLQLCRELYSSTRKYSRKEIYSSAENSTALQGNIQGKKSTALQRTLQLYKEIFKERNLQLCRELYGSTGIIQIKQSTALSRLHSKNKSLNLHKNQKVHLKPSQPIPSKSAHPCQPNRHLHSFFILSLKANSEFLNLKFIKGDSDKALYEFLDICNEGIQNLSTLGLERNTLVDLMLVYIIQSKLDNSLKKDWELHIDVQGYPSYEELITFLEKYARSLANLRLRETSKTSPKPNKVYSHATSILLSTALIRVNDLYGNSCMARALVDTGSQRTLITDSLRKTLNLPVNYSDASMYGIGDNCLEKPLGEVDITFSPHYSNMLFTAKALILNKITCNLPNFVMERSRWPHLVGLRLADPTFDKPAPMIVIIGADIAPSLYTGQVRFQNERGPTACNSKLGWLLLGKIMAQQSDGSLHHSVLTFCATSIDNQLRKFWELDSIPHDSDYQRVLWRDSPSDAIQEYKLTTITYGTACAPYLAIRTLHQFADDEAMNYPVASEIVKRDFYVDDLLTGADTVEEAQVLIRQIIALLAEGGFSIRKWVSNSPKILDFLPKDQKGINQSFDYKDLPSVKLLGILRDPSLNSFTIRVKPPDIQVYSKRPLLSLIARIYDPLGWMAPLVIIFKIMLRKLWAKGCNWDERLPECIQWQLTGIEGDINQLNKISIPRYIPCRNSMLTLELHGFCDSSEKAYAAVIYVKSCKYDGSVNISLIASKTKVAPIKVLSLPRLELCSALLVSAIQRKTPSHSWFHVPGSENPADLATRGLTPAQLVDNQLWWQRPHWLQDPLVNSYIDLPPSDELSPETLIEERSTILVYSGTYARITSEILILDKKLM
ncbi:hypothetical protein LAZ67_22001344 [Cordylochernes scorpioides]|uniref:Peptidase A2 domain-containing protein n=1 Tax=Cordylochernes scorpioides TaxID=51811 RepID=A0ABY6LP01_9ARAC|nr:hypothetical protein LAZ67_22001344 [Cordylochernes scorpioides]